MLLIIAQTNTFQVVLATNGINSFTLFQYADIQWILADPRTDTSTSTTSTSGSAQVGFSAGDGMRYYVLNASNVLRLNSTSNINKPGLWIFRVDGPSVVRRGMFVVSFFLVVFYVTICISFFLSIHDYNTF